MRSSMSFILASGLAACLFASGCNLVPARTVEVKIPVPVKIQPPVELLVYDPPAAPKWVSPDSAGALSCVTAEGEDRERALHLYHIEREALVKAWIKQTTP